LRLGFACALLKRPIAKQQSVNDASFPVKKTQQIMAGELIMIACRANTEGIPAFLKMKQKL